MKTIRKIIYTAMVFTACMLFSIGAYADGTVTVNVSKTFIRANTTSGANIVATAVKGNSYSVVSTITVDGVLWYEVTVWEGTNGFIRGDLVNFDENGIVKAENQGSESETAIEQSSNPEAIVQVEPLTAKANTDVRVREGASTQSGIVATIRRRTEVTIDSYIPGEGGLNWYHVSFASGEDTVSGYIRSDLVTLLGNLTVKVPEEEPAQEEPVTQDPGNDATPADSTVEEATTGNSDVEIKNEPVDTTTGTEADETETEKPATEPEKTESTAEIKPVNYWMFAAIAEMVLIIALLIHTRLQNARMKKMISVKHKKVSGADGDETKNGLKTEDKSQSEAETKTEVKSETKTENKTEAKTENKPATETKTGDSQNDKSNPQQAGNTDEQAAQNNADTSKDSSEKAKTQNDEPKADAAESQNKGPAATGEKKTSSGQKSYNQRKSQKGRNKKRHKR